MYPPPSQQQSYTCYVEEEQQPEPEQGWESLEQDVTQCGRPPWAYCTCGGGAGAGAGAGEGVMKQEVMRACGRITHNGGDVPGKGVGAEQVSAGTLAKAVLLCAMYYQ